MYTFPQLLKKIREESNLTQNKLAEILGVSTILISMIETGQKEPSKQFVIKLANKLGVQAGSIMPFVFIQENTQSKNLPQPEKAFLALGKKLQTYLIEQKSKRLKNYV